MPSLFYLKAKKPKGAQELKKAPKNDQRHTIDLSLLMPVKAAAACVVATCFFFN